MGFASAFYLCLILVFLLPVSVVAQTSQNITLGSSLTAALNQNDSWKSPSGDFAFGFQEVEAGMFLLAIWFEKIPEKTIIWSANGGNLVQQGSRIQLTTDGQFRLNDEQGKQVWVARLAGTGSVSYAAMLDTGNFVLASQDSTNLWESFNLPTDTIVPTQVLKQGSSLIARYAETNYSRGRFTFELQSDGNIVIFSTILPPNSVNGGPKKSTENDPPYYSTYTVGSDLQVIFNQSGSIDLEAKSRSILRNIVPSRVSASNSYQRAILEYDGVFRQYVYPKNNSVAAGRPMAWSLLSYVPENICKNITSGGSGICGYNSYCIIGNDQRHKCLCLPGYSYLDPDDELNGCKQDFASQSCDGGHDAADLFDLQDMMNVDFVNLAPEYDYYAEVTEDWCRQVCLSDCFCPLAVFRSGDGGCWKKKFPLSNGRIDTDFVGKSFVKIRKDYSTKTPSDEGPGKGSKKKNKSTLNLILTMLLSSSAFLNLSLLIATLWAVHRKRRVILVQPSRAIQGMSLQSFTYKELEEATNKFDEELGKGACSTVYKGVLDIGNNKNLIAVKRLDNMVKDNDKEFQAEMSAIGKTNHKNLVQLLGFCNEGHHRLLVYEYMSNGSLASYLFENSRPSWYKRTEIAFGTARGLVYLHEECSNQIIHCDIKPQNILLDDSFTARISDFGLAKLLEKNQTRTLTEIRGTRGYVAPEWWFRNKPVTVKVDVYSFGILLLELICCRRSFEQDAEDENQKILANWAYDCYEEGRMPLLVQEDEEAMEDIKRVEQFVMIAIWCIQDDPLLRPTMKIVLQMLEGALEVPYPPINPHSSV
ncbi:hypothetical protein SLEP1_g23689 [Rubroshorea leprosula]|uniref:Receptor-like serine/threonine-protein kinase n=1 Tax=Rubroshorea leprosula TaxID=152421 RepID=A0AAV5JMQ1_9ROSI|nr:hypothetical protein SLEP1_g23689 [Rubroshorea leprosula]